MSDYASLLSGLTSVFPVSGTGYVDAGDSHSLGPIFPPAGCYFVLAGVDVWLSGPLTAAGQIILIDQVSTYAFWTGAFPSSDYDLAVGCYRSYRGGFLMNEEGQIDIQFLELAGDGVECNYAYWGYYIPAGWSPVGLPPQQ